MTSVNDQINKIFDALYLSFVPWPIRYYLAFCVTFSPILFAMYVAFFMKDYNDQNPNKDNIKIEEKNE